MADGLMYPTGLGTKTIDFATPAANYFNSYVDQKLKEIDEKKVRATDYEKKVLKAMSVQAIPEMSGKLRDKYNDKIMAYKDEITQRLQKSGGKPSTADEIFIEENGVKLQNEMLMEKNKLDKFVELRKNFSNQTFMNETVNADSYTRDYAKLYDDFMAGKDIDDPDIVMMKNLKPVTSEKYISANYPNVMKNIPVRTGLKTEGGKIVLETSADIEKANQYFNDLYDRDEMLNQRFANNPEGKQKEIDSIIETNSINKVEERRLPSSSGSGSGSLKNPLELISEVGNVGIVNEDNLYEWTPTGTVSPTGSFVDAETGEEGDFSGLDQAKIFKFSLTPNNEGIYVRSKTGNIAKDEKGNVLYGSDVKRAKSKKSIETSAPNKLIAQAKADELFKDSDKATYKIGDVTDVKIEENDKGDLVLTGKVHAKKTVDAGFWSKDKVTDEVKEVEIIVPRAVDPSGIATKKLPLNRDTYQYLGKNADRIVVNDPRNPDKKVRLKDYVAQIEDDRLKGGNEKKQDAKTESYSIGGTDYSKEDLIAKGYSEAQIDRFIKEGKIKKK